MKASAFYSMKFGFDAVGEKGLQERLIRDIALVGKPFQILQKRFREAEGNRLRRRFQLGKRGCFGIAPVHEVSRIMSLPETPFFSLILEIWDFLFHGARNIQMSRQ